MIHWLVQTSSDHPNLVQAGASEGVFAASEQVQLGLLKTSKRRHDWLIGRMTSKLLVQALVRQETGRQPELNDLLVSNDPHGAPRMTWETGFGQIPISLSISHSGDRAFCAALGFYSADHYLVGLIGADIERIETRSPDFAYDYFTETEIALVERAPFGSRDMLVTATWSAKEAALKALHLGLTVDTRTATCLFEPVGSTPEEWAPFQIEWDVRRLNRCASGGALHDPPALVGWWRILDDYVLTLATDQAARPQDISLPQEHWHDQNHARLPR
jgi:phosphopantetheinyl transferase (holo-ACP synthase)